MPSFTPRTSFESLITHLYSDSSMQNIAISSYLPMSLYQQPVTSKSYYIDHLFSLTLTKINLSTFP